MLWPVVVPTGTRIGHHDPACHLRTRLALCKTVDPESEALLRRTEQPRRPNGERKLARDPFMQATWVLLAVAALVQLGLLLWLDVAS